MDATHPRLDVAHGSAQALGLLVQLGNLIGRVLGVLALLPRLVTTVSVGLASFSLRPVRARPRTVLRRQHGRLLPRVTRHESAHVRPDMPRVSPHAPTLGARKPHMTLSMVKRRTAAMKRSMRHVTLRSLSLRTSHCVANT